MTMLHATAPAGAGDGPAGGEALLPATLLHHAATRPEAPAYIFADARIARTAPLRDDPTGQVLTYGALAAQAGAVARMLRDRGLVPAVTEGAADGQGDGADDGRGGPRYALMVQPGPSFVVALLAAFLLRGAAVPLAPPASPAARGRAGAILARADCTAVLTDRATVTAMGADWATILGDLPPVLLDDAPAADGLPPLPDTRADEMAVLQFTSGSTGDPKGVIIPHGALAAQHRVICAGVRPEGEERLVTWLPPEHDMGLVGGLLFNAWRGGPAWVLSPASFMRRPQVWLDLIGRVGATITVAPNSAYDLCVRAIPPTRRAALDLSSLRIALNGAEPIRAETMEAFTEAFAPRGFDPACFMPCYGMAEATLLVTGVGRGEGAEEGWFDGEALDRGIARPVAPGAGRRLVSSGPARTSAPLCIVDPDSRAALPEGRAGEIWIAGDSLGRGYFRQPEQSAATFAARLDDGSGRYLRSGDIGFLHGGSLYVTGRIKDVVMWLGRTLHAADLEQMLAAADVGIRPGRVAVHQDADGQVNVVAEIAPARIDQDDGSALARGLWHALVSGAGVEPGRVLLVRPGSLLWTTSGKIRRSASLERAVADAPEGGCLLLDWLPYGDDDRAGPRAAAVRRLRAAAVDGPPAEAALADFFVEWIAGSVGVEPAEIDPEMPWADLGLSSLMTSEMIADLELAIDRAVEIELLFELHSPAELAAELAAPGA